MIFDEKSTFSGRKGRELFSMRERTYKVSTLSQKRVKHTGDLYLGYWW